VELLNKAFVLINAELGKNITNDLKQIPEVKQVYDVYGVYDYIIRVEADSMEKLKDVISSKVRQVKNIRSTLTMIIID
jgi:DNA-binding Lrp family transcriptional regulator